LHSRQKVEGDKKMIQFFVMIFKWPKKAATASAQKRVQVAGKPNQSQNPLFTSFFLDVIFFFWGGAGLQRVKVESGRTKAKEVGAKKKSFIVPIKL
jgi:hypothetical protein